MFSALKKASSAGAHQAHKARIRLHLLANSMQGLVPDLPAPTPARRWPARSPALRCRLTSPVERRGWIEMIAHALHLRIARAGRATRCRKLGSPVTSRPSQAGSMSSALPPAFRARRPPARPSIPAEYIDFVEMAAMPNMVACLLDDMCRWRRPASPAASASGIGYSNSSRDRLMLPNFKRQHAGAPSLMRTRTERPGAAAR